MLRSDPSALKGLLVPELSRVDQQGTAAFLDTIGIVALHSDRLSGVEGASIKMSRSCITTMMA